MNKAHAWPGAVLILLLVVLGCSRGELQSSSQGCTPGVSECVSDRLVRVCPDDGAGYLAFPCAAEESCQAGACVGPCQTGVSSCISKDVLRVCTADGKASTAVACPIDSECQNGRCSAIKLTPLCNAGDWKCATETVGKECDRDGMSWVMTPCALGERCSTEPGSQRCVPDPTTATCKPGSSVCLDDFTALHCTPDGSGYSVQECPLNAPCAEGLCRGSVCTVGESRCEGVANETSLRDGVSSCVDGESWERTACARDEYCIFDGIPRADAPTLATWWGSGQVGPPPLPLPALLSASCQPVGCAPFNHAYAAPVCGNPDNPALDPHRYVSQCEGFLPFSSFLWVPRLCPDPTECAPADRISTARCSSTCLPGDVRCSSDRLALETCTFAGEWGTSPVPCEKGQLCATSNAGETACMDAECAYFLSKVPDLSAGGRCENERRFRRCGQDGLLEDVDTGCNYCRLDWDAVTTPATPTPFLPGICVGPNEGERCTIGARSCTSSDQYWECVGLDWSTAELHRCSPGTTCFPSRDWRNDETRAVCAECEPRSARCTDDGGLEYCDANGVRRPPTKCAVGSCQWGTRADGTSGYGCHTECLPGSVQCTSPTEYQKCGADGRVGTAKFTCAGSLQCHTGQDFLDVGCVECVGPNHGRSVPDSRCEGNAIVECQGNDTWGLPHACTGNTQCEQTEGSSNVGVWATCALRPEP